MKNYDRKWRYMYGKQQGRCPITGFQLNREAQLHHAHIANVKWARKAYPHFIDSIWNLALVDPDGHMSKPLPKKIPEWRIKRIERGLFRHPLHSAIVNLEVIDETFSETHGEPQSKKRSV